MNAKKTILAIALVLTGLMILFPPTVQFIKETAEHEAGFRFEYMFIFSIPEDVRINGIVLLSQWFGLLLITGIAMSFFPSSDPTRINKANDNPVKDAASGKDNAEQDAR